MAAATTSFSALSPSNYDVFLSFRGETRNNFTSHLFAALRRKKINTFRDEAINKGDKISVKLLNAKIEGSRISVIIFSKDYASSEWCLDELNKILECKKKNGQIVIPVFYHVHPSDVRHQIGSFKGTFVEHETEHREMPAKVQKWKDSLAEASRLSGYESTKFRDEADLVDVIVKDVLKKLEDITVPTDFDGLIGINSRIEEVKTLLRIGLSDIRIVGIWGMGGIGKTTLAETIFKQVSPDFDGKCFMANVREKTKIGGGLEQLQKEVLSHLLEENIEKGGPSTPQYTRVRVKKTKVFIVLDDVNKFEQLENLVTKLGPFGEGSRIIITTRDKQVLDKHRVNLVYKVEELNYGEAHELFCNYAFKESHDPEDFMVLSERAIDRAKGNPLALKILGSFLCPKSKREWENALDNLKLISDSDISDVFQMSYKELRTKEQQIFLDIACFFKGDDKDHMISIFDDPCSIRSSLDILVEKSLITISCNKLKMHDLLQEMGEEIVREESEEPENRSRLWDHKDILPVLNEKKGTNSIRGIFLNMSQIKDIKDLDSSAFVNMSHLKFLKFYVPEQYGYMSSKVGLPQGLEYLSDKLRYLYWHGYSWKTLPRNFTAHNLIELSLPYSKVQQLWEGKKKAFKLKFIDLHHSQDFITIPDTSDVPNLERLNLSDCAELSRIPRSIENYNKLGILCLKRCKRIKSFPRNICFKSPIIIDLSFCVELTEFPEISGNILELNLSGTAIDEVLPEIGSLTELEKLDLSFCDKLKAVSTSICKLKSLCHLALDYCEMLEGFPDISEKMECLEYVGLKYTAIKKLPPSIENLQGLKTLSLMECSKLDSLPENLGNLKSLKFIHGKRLAISQLPSSITDLKQLEQLSLSECKGLVLPSLSGLCSLKTLELDDCGIMKIPEDIGDLFSLENVNLKGNNFESLPSSMEKLSNLRELILRNCSNLESLSMLPLHPFRLEATDCERLRYLPKLPLLLQEVNASVLDKLSKQYTCNKVAISMELDFSNCPYLIGNTADSKVRIRHMALASLRQFCENEFTLPYGVSICLPGSQIPEWFRRQISGSSINIQQPQSFGGLKFIGFALCAVVAVEKGLQADEDFAIICKYRFNTNTFSKSKHVDRQFLFKTIKNYSSDDSLIILGFHPCSIVGLSDAISFDFFINSVSKTETKLKVIRCGVCAMQVHLIDTKTNKLTPQKRNLTLTFSSPLYFYDVFLCFSWETQHFFTSRLFAALQWKKINTFMDFKEDVSIGALSIAKIEGSRVSVVIFSEDYASSEWCLDELNTILDCKEKYDQIVIPVFYCVHPSDVREQIGSFKKAFVEYEKKYKEMPDKVQKWRDSLAEASCLSGHMFSTMSNEADLDEADFYEEALLDVIVKDVLKKLEDLN